MKRWMTGLLAALLCLQLGGCGAEAVPKEPEEPAQTEDAVQKPVGFELSAERDPFTLAMPELQEAAFWIALAEEPQAVRMTPEEIRAYEQRLPEDRDADIEVLRDWPETLSAAQLQAQLDCYPERPSAELRTVGGKVTVKTARLIGENRNLAGIQDENPVGWGFITEDCILRTYPSALPMFESSIEFDLGAETALRTWEPIRLLHTSADGAWQLVRAYDYLGWAPSEAVASCERAEWESLCDRLETSFLTVTAARIALDGSFVCPERGTPVLKMGTRLPLESAERADNAAAAGCYLALLPVRQADGSLKTVPWRVQKQEGVTVGALPYTTEQVLTEAFALLGHRYGWGGTAGCWDCSSLCQDLYRTMGLDLPRNAGAQRCVPGAMKVQGLPAEQKRQLLAQFPAGTLLEMPGHIAVYLGAVNGEGFVLHATHGVYSADGRFFESNAVIVTSAEARRQGGTILEQTRYFVLPEREKS